MHCIMQFDNYFSQKRSFKGMIFFIYKEDYFMINYLKSKEFGNEILYPIIEALGTDEDLHEIVEGNKADIIAEASEFAAMDDNKDPIEVIKVFARNFDDIVFDVVEDIIRENADEDDEEDEEDF